MKFLLSLTFLVGMMPSKTIFDFQKSSDITGWRIVNDGVMGGLSSGIFMLNSEGHAVFKGIVSLENYGGFTSVRYSLNSLSVEDKKTVVLRVKGDGKNYQFRVKAKSDEYFSYITTFATSGKWEEIEIPLNELYPSYRGRKLNTPNFSNNYIDELTILIANKRNESFALEIDEITLK